jgi:hypothetical protein
MNFNDLLKSKSIDPEQVIVLRHRPNKPALNKILPWLASERHDVFNAYQQTQGERVERAVESLIGKGHVASFIGINPGTALFIGLYKVEGSKPLSRKQFWIVPAYAELKSFGMRGFTEEESRNSVQWFDLTLTDFYTAWKGKLVIGWPPPERAWMRRAHKNNLPVQAVFEESALDAAMPAWDAIDVSWEELRVLPTKWKSALQHWRGIYYIFDTSDSKGYVGSAYGSGNILDRWLGYAATGHGGNKLLRSRNSANFRFSILQRLSPDLEAAEVIQVEASWKQRLHSRHPFGLNDN